MQDWDRVRLAGAIVDLLESFGYCKEGIYEISELVKHHADVKEKYDTVMVGPEAPRQCIN